MNGTKTDTDTEGQPQTEVDPVRGRSAWTEAGR